MVAQAIPTADEAENARRIKDLKNREAQGKMGLTDQQRGAAWSDTAGAANSRIAEERARGDATLAATGNTSGGAVAQQQASQMNATAMASQAAADSITKMDQQAHDDSLQELSDRIAVKGAKGQERKNEAIQAVGQAGKVIGEYEGTTGTSIFNEQAPSMFDGWTKDMTQYTPEQQTVIANAKEFYDQGMTGAAQRLLTSNGIYKGK